MRYILYLAFAASLCAHDWVIVPGTRVGPVTASSTEAELRTAFGSAAVVRSTIQIDEKIKAPGIEVYRGVDGESLAVVWPRQEGLWWPLEVIPCYPKAAAGCRWRTASGVQVGATVAEIEKINGKPFLLYPSSALEVWPDPLWSDGALERALGEDIELQFEGAGEPFYAGGTFARSTDKPLRTG